MSLIGSILHITAERRKFENLCLRVSLATLLNLLCGKVGSKPHVHDQISVYGPAQSLCPVEQINMTKRFLDNSACHNLLFCFLVCVQHPCLLCVIIHLDLYCEERNHLFAVVLYLAQRSFIVNWTSSRQTCKLKGQSMEVTAAIQTL